MITIMMLPDIERFLSVVKACKGDVTLRLADHKSIDLKNDKSAQEMLTLVNAEKAGLDIELSEDTDMVPFLKYMTEASRIA